MTYSNTAIPRRGRDARRSGTSTLLLHLRLGSHARTSLPFLPDSPNNLCPTDRRPYVRTDVELPTSKYENPLWWNLEKRSQRVRPLETMTILRRGYQGSWADRAVFINVSNSS